jgi:hypothetical protein
MTEDEVIKFLYEYFSSLFPKACPTCGRNFNTLLEYITFTKPIGSVVSYDAEDGNWETSQPIGSGAFANCECGSTLALTTEEMPLPQRLVLLSWLKAETQNKRVDSSNVLNHIRGEVRKLALGKG